MLPGVTEPAARGRWAGWWGLRSGGHTQTSLPAPCLGGWAGPPRGWGKGGSWGEKGEERSFEVSTETNSHQAGKGGS